MGEQAGVSMVFGGGTFSGRDIQVGLGKDVWLPLSMKENQRDDRAV